MSSYKQADFRAEIRLIRDTKKGKGVKRKKRHQYNKKTRKGTQIKMEGKYINMGKEGKRYKRGKKIRLK